VLSRPLVNFHCRPIQVGSACDNCILVYNPDQADTNGDGIGDACCESSNIFWLPLEQEATNILTDYGPNSYKNDGYVP
jgi:hypothetical protein